MRHNVTEEKQQTDGGYFCCRVKPVVAMTASLQTTLQQQTFVQRETTSTEVSTWTDYITSYFLKIKYAHKNTKYIFIANFHRNAEALGDFSLEESEKIVDA